MPEETKYDNRQSVLLFIAGVAMCAAFFVFGLLVGRWSVTQSDRQFFGGAPGNGRLAGTQSAGTVSPPSIAGPSVPESPPSATASENPGPPDETDGSTESATTARPALEERPSEPGAYVVRAASFSKSDDAETFAATLRSRGFENAHTRLEKGARKDFWVILGPYSSRDDASKAALELRNNGVSNVQIISER